MYTLINALATEPLPAKGFVLRKDRSRKAEKTQDSTEHGIQRTVDFNYHDCADFRLNKDLIWKEKGKHITLVILAKEKDWSVFISHDKGVCLLKYSHS